MNKFIIIVFFALIFSCKSEQKTNVESLFEADRSFSDMAKDRGYPAAFIEYAHPDVVLLRKNSMPLKGKTALTNAFKNIKSEGVHFTWEPIDGDIAISGEIGYTYGIYTIQIDTVQEKGTYVSVWKKDENGKWKYVLDSGNEGIGE